MFYEVKMSLSYLNTVVARGDFSILHLDVVRRVRELALAVRPAALVPLELSTHLQLQPPRVLLVQQRADVEQRALAAGSAGGTARRGRGRPEAVLSRCCRHLSHLLRGGGRVGLGRGVCGVSYRAGVVMPRRGRAGHVGHDAVVAGRGALG